MSKTYYKVCPECGLLTNSSMYYLHEDKCKSCYNKMYAKEASKKKIKCICGDIIIQRNYIKHLNTIKHNNKIKNSNHT